MKAVTYTQWSRMNSRQRSWLVCKARGYRARVFWSLIHRDGKQCGGSYDSLKWATGLVERAKEMVAEREKLCAKLGDDAGSLKWNINYPDHIFSQVRRYSECTVRCDVAFPLYAENDHSAPELFKEMVATGHAVVIEMTGVYAHVTCGRVYEVMPTLAEAASLAFLKVRGLVSGP